MKKVIVFSVIMCMPSFYLIAMEQPTGGELSLEIDNELKKYRLNIALAVQAASREDSSIRQKILTVFAKHQVNLAAEDKNNAKKLLQLGAIYFGAKDAKNETKIIALNRDERNSYYQSYFKKYTGLLNALIELANIKGYTQLVKGKSE